MLENEFTPDTVIEELAVKGLVSQRALKVAQRARLVTIRDVAAYHQQDPRYKTLGGCGLKTRRELNQLIKGAYGSLRVQISEKETQVPRVQPESGSWQDQWLAEDDGEENLNDVILTGVAAELDQIRPLSEYERRYYVKCRDYAAFIRERKGIPQVVSDIEQHRWFLQQSQSTLSARRAALFDELCQELGL